MKLNLLVIKTADIEALKAQYEALGILFKYHQHGAGPWHFASDTDGFVFEIYPLAASIKKADASTRLGFEVAGLETKVKAIKKAHWTVLKELVLTKGGRKMVVQDLDGRKVELVAVLS